MTAALCVLGGCGWVDNEEVIVIQMYALTQNKHYRSSSMFALEADLRYVG